MTSDTREDEPTRDDGDPFTESETRALQAEGYEEPVRHNAFHQELNADAPELPGDHDADDDTPITIHDLAVYRLKQLGRTVGDVMTGQDFADVKLQIMGGCQDCGASLAAYNAYPSKSGFWKCEDDIGDQGWLDVAKADAEIRSSEAVV